MAYHVSNLILNNLLDQGSCPFRWFTKLAGEKHALHVATSQNKAVPDKWEEGN